jgi:RNA-binding protein 25
MREHLHIWDDDASDEPFYTDRSRWRAQRARRLIAEEQADAESRAYEEREAENLRRESEAFLARQMDEMQALAEEQRKAGMLLDDGAPVKLNVSLAPSAAPNKQDSAAKDKATVPMFGNEEEEEEAARRRKTPLVKLDFSASNDSEKAKERLGWIRESVPRDKDALFKAKVRWDGVTEVRPLFLAM